LGIRAGVGESFGDIFKNNAYMNGLLPVQLEPDQVRAMLAFLTANPGIAIDIDLRAQTVATPAGHSFRFSIHPLIKRRMMQGMDEIALTRTYRGRIDAFEARHLADYFWLLRGLAR
jgi:3-isopropylmalate/(R)-2-methylmalate dehydratase small subunit